MDLGLILTAIGTAVSIASAVWSWLSARRARSERQLVTRQLAKHRNIADFSRVSGECRAAFQAFTKYAFGSKPSGRSGVDFSHDARVITDLLASADGIGPALRQEVREFEQVASKHLDKLSAADAPDVALKHGRALLEALTTFQRAVEDKARDAQGLDTYPQD